MLVTTGKSIYKSRGNVRQLHRGIKQQTAYGWGLPRARARHWASTAGLSAEWEDQWLHGVGEIGGSANPESVLSTRL